MSYLDSLGEIVLIFSILIFIINISRTSRFDSPFRTAMTIALFFIVITASFGAARFAGIDQLIEIHDLLSLLSAKFAMVVYVFSLPIVFLSNTEKFGIKINDEAFNNKVISLSKSAMMALLIFNAFAFLLDMNITGLLSDIVLIIGFVMFSLVVSSKALVYAATIVIVLVPVTSQLHLNDDLTMAIFHLMLAAHFWLINLVFKKHLIRPTFTEVNT